MTQPDTITDHYQRAVDLFVSASVRGTSSGEAWDPVRLAAAQTQALLALTAIGQRLTAPPAREPDREGFAPSDEVHEVLQILRAEAHQLLTDDDEDGEADPGFGALVNLCVEMADSWPAPSQPGPDRNTPYGLLMWLVAEFVVLVCRELLGQVPAQGSDDGPVRDQPLPGLEHCDAP